jgi:hypothetical protein
MHIRKHKDGWRNARAAHGWRVIVHEPICKTPAMTYWLTA